MMREFLLWLVLVAAVVGSLAWAASRSQQERPAQVADVRIDRCSIDFILWPGPFWVRIRCF